MTGTQSSFPSTILPYLLISATLPTFQFVKHTEFFPQRNFLPKTFFPTTPSLIRQTFAWLAPSGSYWSCLTSPHWGGIWPTCPKSILYSSKSNTLQHHSPKGSLIPSARVFYIIPISLSQESEKQKSQFSWALQAGLTLQQQCSKRLNTSRCVPAGIHFLYQQGII